MVAGTSDFSHGPQHVFWTSLDEIIKSRDMFPKKIPTFWTSLNENGRVAKNQNKIYYMKIHIKNDFYKHTIF